MVHKLLSEILRDIAPRALIEAFGAYDFRLKEHSGLGSNYPFMSKVKPSEAIVAGVVGFTGAAFRGTVLVASTFEVITLARPTRVRAKPLSKNSSSDWIMVRDWAGELANQVLGRIKNRLAAHGVVFDVSPPAALSGTALMFAQPKSPTPRQHTFVPAQSGLPDEARVWFCLDALFDSSQEVGPASPSADEPSEGTIIEFD